MKAIFRIFAVALILVFSSISLAVENKSAQDQPAVSQVQQVVNINTADAETLTNLKGVGIKKAEAIIAWREANGGFTSVEQLLEVKGIGVAILDENRNSLRIE